jgi:TRAP-type mannitol/chloroaromatic compound transport system substrate-binding protein
MTKGQLISEAERFEKLAQEMREIGDMAAAKAFADMARACREEAEIELADLR